MTIFGGLDGEGYGNLSVFRVVIVFQNRYHSHTFTPSNVVTWFVRSKTCVGFHTVSNSLLTVRDQFLYPLLNCVYGSFLFLWERTAKSDIGALLIDLYELLSCKLAFIRYQASADCKVPFGSRIVPFIIVAMVQRCG